MFKNGNTSILKLISTTRGSTVQREYVDSNTPRSHTQHRILCSKHCSPSGYSPSPSIKRKRRLTESDLISQEAKGIQKYITMSATLKPEIEKTVLGGNKKKLSPDLKDLRNEMKTDTQELLAPICDSLGLLLEMKEAWEDYLNVTT